MALTEKQHLTLQDLRARETVTAADEGRAQALLRYAEPSDSERRDIRDVIAKRTPPTEPGREAPGPQLDPEAADLMTAFDESPDADVRVLRALVASGVRKDHVTRAVKMIRVDADMSLQDAKEEVRLLQADLPEFFTDPRQPQPRLRDGRPHGTPPNQRGHGQSVKEAGHEAAKKHFGVKDKADQA